jgi:hypothetical protein
MLCGAALAGRTCAYRGSPQSGRRRSHRSKRRRFQLAETIPRARGLRIGWRSIARAVDCHTELAHTVAEALPWTRYLDDAERAEFVKGLPAVIQDCEDLGTFAPLEVYLRQWRETAAILADPELADGLTSAIKKTVG